jgi:Cof subfamily protein (haloacid dehalogenase superfamily)
MFKLVAMDLDGTLFNQFRKISLKNQIAIEGLKKRHLTIVIASGRTYPDIAQGVAPLRLENYDRAYFICYNGVFAAKTKPYEVTYRKMIHGQDVRRIARLVEAAGMKMHVFCEGKVYLSEDIEYIIESDTELMAQAPRVHMSDYDGPDEVYKILILDDEEKLDDFQKKIPFEISESYTIFKSASHLLEFVHKLGSKGDALAEVARSEGIRPEEVMAFGDEENDISMLKYAGLGIAMDNAKPKVKKAAKALTLSNKLDGVGEAINKYVLMGDGMKHDF